MKAKLLVQADLLIDGPVAVLVHDDTARPEKGSYSVGAAPQYVYALGKNADCKTLESFDACPWRVPVVASLRLFLPAAAATAKLM